MPYVRRRYTDLPSILITNALHLQHDLNSVSMWSQPFEINNSKCKFLSFNRKGNPNNFKINGRILDRETEISLSEIASQ